MHDLTEARLAAGGQVRFEAADVTPRDIEGPAPRIEFTVAGRRMELACDVIAGCCRPPRTG